VKEPGVVAGVGPVEHIEEALVHVLPFEQFLEASIFLDAPVLADAEEEDAVDGLLDRDVQFIDGEVCVPQGNVFGEHIPPFLDIGKDGFVNSGGPFLSLRFSGKPVE